MPDNMPTPWWLTLIIAWLPFVFTLGTFLYAVDRIRRALSTKDGRTVADVVLELTTEIKRLNDRSK